MMRGQRALRNGVGGGRLPSTCMRWLRRRPPTAGHAQVLALLARPVPRNGLGAEDAHAAATKSVWYVSAEPAEIASTTEGSRQAPVCRRHSLFRS
jgi:hypothetical protein